jgi:hypothetical protein
MNLLDLLLQSLGGDAVGRISAQLGIDEATARRAIQAALPLIITALAQNASSPQGADSLYQALASDHDGTLLDNVPSYLDHPDTADGQAILGHVFGEQESAVVNQFSAQTGLDSDLLMKLLPILAPIVLAQLGKQQRDGGLDSGGLADVLSGEKASIQEQAAPDGSLGGLLGGLVTGMLDTDRDGNATEEAIQMGSSILGQLFGGGGKR